MLSFHGLINNRFMQISEIFYSIQGEGVNIGKPAIFIRLNLCDLRCVWCDSKYTWRKEFGKEMTIEKIIKEIKKYPAKHLVITGGEPLIQQKELINLLKKLGDYFIEIETNGTIQPLEELTKLINQYNCSPKLKNAKTKNRELKKFPAEKTYYKFVVERKKDIDEIKKIMKTLDKEKIILMPQGTTKKNLAKTSKLLAEICKKENLRFTPRLHMEIWGNKRKK